MHYILFDSSVNGPLGAYTFLLLRIMLLWTCMYRYHLKIFLSILLGLYSKAQLLDHIIILSLTFSKKWPTCFPQWLQYLIFLPTANKDSNFSTFLPILPTHFLSPFHFSFLIDVLRGARRHFTVVCKDISWFQKYLDIHISLCKLR